MVSKLVGKVYLDTLLHKASYQLKIEGKTHTEVVLLLRLKLVILISKTSVRRTQV